VGGGGLLRLAIIYSVYSLFNALFKGWGGLFGELAIGGIFCGGGIGRVF